MQKLEQGARQASLTTLHKLASALDGEIGELLGQKTNLPEPSEDSGVVAIRHAITNIDDLLTKRAAKRPPATTESMRRAVTYGWGALGAGRYDLLGKVLPNALLNTRTIELVGETADLAAQLNELVLQGWIHVDHAEPAGWRGVDKSQPAASPQVAQINVPVVLAMDPHSCTWDTRTRRT